jgi:thiol-disulfide isomerase/thioredoxin
LKNLKGKVVVLNFWATWCGPCRREIPELNNLVEKYKDNSDVVFVAITNDLRERVANFLSSNEFKYKVAFDVDSVYQKYNVTAVPTHVIIDKDGFISSRIVGSLPQMDEILSEKIEKLLK